MYYPNHATLRRSAPRCPVTHLAHVDLEEADQLVDPVVALAEQNVIYLAPAPCPAAHLYKQTIRGIAAEGETEAL